MEVILPNREQYSISKGYVWQDELMFGQCDALLNIKITTLLEHLVTVSSQHIRTFGMTYESFLESGTAFVLVRSTLTITRLPRCFELLSLYTWIDGTKGPYYQRVVEWRDHDGHTIVSSNSDWVVIETTSRQLCKPDKNDLRFQTKSPITVPPCQKVKLSSAERESLTVLGSHTVTRSEIDGNGHLHSSQYANIIWDVLPSHLLTKNLQQFSIEFQKELTESDSMTIFGTELDSLTYVIEGMFGDQQTFKAKLQFI